MCIGSVPLTLKVPCCERRFPPFSGIHSGEEAAVPCEIFWSGGARPQTLLIIKQWVPILFYRNYVPLKLKWFQCLLSPQRSDILHCAWKNNQIKKNTTRICIAYAVSTWSFWFFILNSFLVFLCFFNLLLTTRSPSLFGGSRKEILRTPLLSFCAKPCLSGAVIRSLH